MEETASKKLNGGGVPETLNSTKTTGKDTDIPTTQAKIHSIASPNKMVLGTAQITIHHGNKATIVRALCDNGSQVNLVTKQAIRPLGVKLKPSGVSFSGIGGSRLGASLGCAVLRIKTLDGKFIEGNFHVVQTITNYQPPSTSHSWQNLGLELADKQYREKGTISALLGIEIWVQMIHSGIIRIPQTLGVAQNTKLGYVIFDVVGDPYQLQDPYIGAIAEGESHEGESQEELLDQLKRFWELESVPNRKLLSNEEKLCEEIFLHQHTRGKDGRYSVKIPFKSNLDQLGRSKNSALKQFFSLEFKMRKNQSLRDQYHAFMGEYEALGHMQRINESSESGYYTPHHAVISATKFRTVFNASARTSSGITLNETQMVGEKLQLDLFYILLNFRKFKFGITADIVKMYRQILVHKEDRKFQKILWRYDENKPVGVYELNTVTYGHACAPHCAIRALVQCARDNAERFPMGASQVEKCFYVDDFISGEDSVRALEEVKSEVTSLLQKGCFEMAKWRTNGATNAEIEFKDEEAKAVLGLFWNTKTDQFFYKAKGEGFANPEQWTKRKLLSRIGRLYDPLGFLGPVIIRGKLFIQQLWINKADWDEALPPPLEEKWKEYNNELTELTQIRVDRWFKTQKTSEIQLHGFCDASELAYGAVIYARVRTDHNTYTTTIITSKSRVAPIKVMTMPRLELCAANLLTTLLESIYPTFDTQKVSIFSWTDSQIALHWITKEPAKLKIFVANRAANIKEKTEQLGINWRWISGKENPADLISRGLTTREILTNSSWWHGPTWLLKNEKDWPSNQPAEVTETEPEVAQEYKIHLIRNQPRNELTRGEFPLLECYGDWKKLLRVTATIFKARDRFSRIQPAESEYNRAELYLIRLDQSRSFGNELAKLREDGSGILSGLNVKILPEEGIVRLDGRLRGEYLTTNEKFPILLAKTSLLGQLLIRNAHYELQHGGNQLMLQYLRTKFWIIGARISVKTFNRKCPTCFRFRMNTNQQRMAALPPFRIQPQRAFLKIGIDYAGPVSLRFRLGRNPIITKAYIAVFVCLVTRAVHLELVSDATTTAFIAAFRRMTSRRGHVVEVVSDNGLNFVGGNNYLQQIIRKINDEAPEVEQTFNLRWRFITPNAPHHGGIYEAAVKSAKHHLRRVIGETTLTFEEYATILSQVEACLNSRPLGPLSDEATDLTALTPGHFLIGEAPIAIPEEGRLTEAPVNRLTRFQLLQQMVQHFWDRWHKEYLMTMINRTKWRNVTRNLRVGDLVIISEENLPPTRWKLGRVEETYPGEDNLVRSVLIKTKDGQFRRPVTKLGLLLENEEEE